MLDEIDQLLLRVYVELAIRPHKMTAHGGFGQEQIVSYALGAISTICELCHIKFAIRETVSRQNLSRVRERRIGWHRRFFPS